MQIHQGQLLELLHGGGLVAHPHHVADALLRHVTRRHGEVLGGEQPLDGVHGELIRHVRLVLGILSRLLKLLLAVFQLLLGIFQLLFRIVHLL